MKESDAQSASNAAHAQASLTGVQAVIAALRAKDSVRALQEATPWLESLQGAADFSVTQRYEAAERMDLALMPHHARLLEQYIALKPLAKFQEGLLWRAATGYWKALGNAYLECVVRIVSDVEIAEVFRQRFPGLVARAMHAQVQQIKWILMRYGYVSDIHWTAVARLYGYADAGAFVDEPIDLYPGETGQTCIRVVFLRAMMLGVSATGGLSPVKQDMAERAIAHFSKLFVSGAHAAAGCNFFFDLHGGMAPARVLAEAPRGARLFYFGAGDALDAVQRAVDTFNATGQLPPALDLGANADADQVADTLLHLAFNWEKELPARDSVRRKIATTLQIVQGLEGVLAQGNQSLRETWVVENTSHEGYGLIVPDRRGEWLQVGVLIGMLPETERARWGAGVVRRVETDARGQRRVGLQVLSRVVVPATLCARGATGERSTPHHVVLLAAEPSPSGYVQVLLRLETFKLDGEFEITRLPDGKTYTVTASGLVEAGPDFQRVRFRVSQTSPTA